MNRRLALTFAGSAAIVLTAGSAAVAANLGILTSASQEPVGQLDANTVAELSTPVTSVDPIVVTVDEIVEVPIDDPAPADSPAPVAPSSDSSSGGGYSGYVASSQSGVSSAPAVTPPAPTTIVSPHESDHESGHEIEHADD
jgi:hypothetical protein